MGGVALLLWGVRTVRTGVERAFGAALRNAVAAGARNRLTGFAAGLGVTALLQSSTATCLIVAAFAGGHLIATAPALAVMLGADVGSTLVAQVLSFDILWLSPVLITAGVIAFMACESSRPRQLGRAALGLGLMLLALRLIVSASEPLRASPALGQVLAPLATEPLVAVAVGVVLTWFAHSSLAIVLLVMSLAASHVVPPVLALYLVIGANIGGALAPLTMTLHGTAARTARRVPLGNLLMRGAAGAALLPFVDQLAPYLPLAGADPARQVVNFHTAFNLALALAFLPLVGPVAALCKRLLPEPEALDDPATPRHLDESALDAPALALAAAARETLRMGDQIELMLQRTILAFTRDDMQLAKTIEKADNTVDRLHEAIKLYLARIPQDEMDEAETRRYAEIVTFTTNLEHVGDIIDKSLMELAEKKIKRNLTFSPQGLREIRDFHQTVVDNTRLAFTVFMSSDAQLARELVGRKAGMRDAERAATENHFARVREGRLDSIRTSSLHLDIIRDLKRINSHVTSIAYPILESAGQLHRSRLKAPRAEKTAAANTPDGGGGLKATGTGSD